MAALGTVLSIAQTLLAAFQCPELKEILSVFGYKSKLEDLQRTVNTINAVFRDAETKKELTDQDKHLIEELKDAVFEADDLFDEFVTLAEQKQLVKASGSLSKKTRRFFSRSHNPLSVAYRMSQGVKDIKKKLDALAIDTQKFSFKIDPEPIRKRRDETCSYVNEVDIVGREDDLESIVGTLLASNDQCDVSFVTIVGIGGLGKTALAQLVYNDPRVTSAFPLRLWTCVADQDQKKLVEKEILCKILGQQQEGSTLEQVQKKLQDQLAGKKFLLVLDDVWTENRDQWCKLVPYLRREERGSWIMITTRSQETANIIDGRTHKLGGLSKNHSWRLFERTSFTTYQLSSPPGDLVEIGRMIVDGCAGVPLTIRVAGSLLFGQNKRTWQHVQKIGVANMERGKNGIMPILKLSFDHLESPLKSCFSYCALFPKDFRMEKEKLIRLWIAQGYIIPSDKVQSIEDVAEDYFSVLLRRCFFQDIEKYDESDEILSCKIHDLMHDVAQNVAGKEIYTTNTIGGNIDEKVRHMHGSIIDIEEIGINFLGKTRIRSLFLTPDDSRPQQLQVGALVVNCRYLRALDLTNLGIESLPDSVGKLLHLRFLDLSMNEGLEVLPNSITKLYNLQTLILNFCYSLKEYPKDLSRLVKLRVLTIDQCSKLRYMPRGMNSLQSLVGDYIVGGDEVKNGKSSWEQWLDGLEGLKDLNNLRGHLSIEFRWTGNNIKSVVNKKDDRKGGLYLSGKENLNSVKIYFNIEYFREDVIIEDDDDERVMMMSLMMEELQPHSNLKELEVYKYCGVRMPGWLTLLPNLVMLCLRGCDELEYLPCLGNLPHLKQLKLNGLCKLEYIEASRSSAEKGSFFPSLEELEFKFLRKLKGWRRRGEEDKSSSNTTTNPQLKLLLPCLSQLTICQCPELVNLPLCPNAEDLDLSDFNEKLEIIINKSSMKLGEVGPSSSSSSSKLENWACSSSTSDNLVPKLKNVSIDNAAWLKSLPMEALLLLETLDIRFDKEMKDLPNCMQYCASLHTLEIIRCLGLKAMPKWMPKLTSLRELEFWECSKRLERRCQKDPPGKDWPYIQHIPTIQFIDCWEDYSDNMEHEYSEDVNERLQVSRRKIERYARKPRRAASNSSSCDILGDVATPLSSLSSTASASSTPYFVFGNPQNLASSTSGPSLSSLSSNRRKIKRHTKSRKPGRVARSTPSLSSSVSALSTPCFEFGNPQNLASSSSYESLVHKLNDVKIDDGA